MGVIEDQVITQKIRLDKGKWKMGLNSSKDSIVKADSKTIKAMVRKVIEEARKKELKEKLEEDVNMEKVSEAEEGSPKLVKLIRCTTKGWQTHWGGDRRNPKSKIDYRFD